MISINALKMMSLISLLILHYSLAQKAATAVESARKNGVKMVQKRSSTSSSSSSRSKGYKVRGKMKVGLILDEEDLIGKVAYSCIQMAISDFYASNPHFKTRLVLHVRHQKKLDVVSAAAAALHLINDVEVKAVIGPLTSRATNFVISLGTKAQVPIISYSATTPTLSSLGSPYFIRATQNDMIQIQAIGALIQAFGWKEVALIERNNEYEDWIMPYLVEILQGTSKHIPFKTTISSTSTDDKILEELYKLKTMQTRVFVVHLWPDIGSRVFLKAKEVGMMSKGYVWISTNGMGNILECLDHQVLESMQGALVVRSYVPKTQELGNFTLRWSKKFKLDHPNMVDTKLNVYGIWAYDAIFALAMAIEEMGTSLNSRFVKISASSSTHDLDNIGISKVGPKLVQAISKARFKGLIGDFSLSRGERQSSILQIINIVGNGWREVGFWTSRHGLMKNLSIAQASRAYSTSKDDLRSIIWPGDSFMIPRGWMIPTSRKKLRIGVPVKADFQEFVKVARNSEKNTTEIIGFCIDVFDVTMAKLPYYVPYEYVPFAKEDGGPLGSYDDLTYQVYLGIYDAVVGDVTITANRSQYVDYTLPYMDSGVIMVVPTREIKANKAWMFLKPLTWQLWVTTLSFFIFIAFVVWVLEHRVNDEFRGPPAQQVGTTIFYIFSTITFSHKTNLVNTNARIVMGAWTFVVIILTQSYTASLTTMLTAQQVKPIVRDVNEMIKTGEYVGYQQGSFMFGFLKGLGFQESKMKPYKNSEELDRLLSKGSKNGGVDAVIDEVPYMKLFMAKFCHKYTILKLNYNTGAFGFVFPKGSPLVSDVSSAVVEVIEGEKMAMIEKDWAIKQDACMNPSSQDASYDSLGLESFWGLFLIVGSIALFTLFNFLGRLLYYIYRFRRP